MKLWFWYPSQDCRSIRQGSINDSDVVEDYRKEKTQFGSPQTSIMKKVGDMHQSMSTMSMELKMRLLNV